jgi:hypothetical protein
MATNAIGEPAYKANLWHDGECTAEAAQAARDSAESVERREQACLLRDLFGPLPFRDVRMDPSGLSWNGGTVGRLAAAAYEEQALPEGTLYAGRRCVLADALEESGCHDREVLGHLREQGGVHLRGCWVLDLVLGKS